MLSDYYIKVKSWILENRFDLYVASIILLVSIASFGLGRLSVLWPVKEPIKIENLEFRTEDLGNDKQSVFSNSASLNPKPLTLNSPQGRYVASKNGTAYHFPWCPGALRIKEENKIWFETREAAEKTGYRPAANCEGL